jgi:LPS export ABC transporter permease LptG/LPS export ABC transporter permease LptF
LTRYILGQLFIPTLLGLLLFTFVMLMNELFLVAQKIISLGLTWDLSSRLILYQLPRLIVMTVPMGTLLGTLIAVGRLSADHEWVAMQSAGMGPWFLLRPVALHGMLGALLSLLIYSVVFPQANFAARSLQGEIALSTHLGRDLRPRVFYTDLPNTVLFVDEIRPGTQGRLEGVLIHRTKAAGDKDQMIVALEGDIYPSPDRSGSLEMDLEDAVIHVYDPASPEGYHTVRFGHYHVKFEPPPIVEAFRNAPRKTALDKNLYELFEELDLAKTEQSDRIRQIRSRRAVLELNQRFALPTATFLFALLAVPLGITRVRTGKGAGFAIAIIVIAVYWVIFTSTRDLGSDGQIPVPLGVWAANLVIVAWIAVALLRLRRSVGRRTGFAALLFPIHAVATGIASVAGRLRRRSERAGADPAAREVRWASTTRFVGLVDRYVGLYYLRILALSLASTYVVYAIVELKYLLDGAIENRQPLTLLLAYFQYLTPGMFGWTLPISCLLGSVVAFTLMARSGELTAVLSSGVSLRRVTVPVLVITLVLCALLFLVQNDVAPATNQKAQQLKDDILGRAPRTYGLSPGGRWTLGTEGRLYHYRHYDAETQTFQGLSVFTIDRRRPAILDHRFGESARWEDGRWVLGPGWHLAFDPDGESQSYEVTEAGETLVMDPPENFARKERTLEAHGDYLAQLSLAELREQIEDLRVSGYDTTRLEVDYQGKLAHPLTPLVIVLLGLPFAFRIGRRGSMYGVGVALLLVIVYWSVMAVFLALGQESLLPPILAAWAPNVLFSILGLYLILHVRT